MFTKLRSFLVEISEAHAGASTHTAHCYSELRMGFHMPYHAIKN